MDTGTVPPERGGLLLRAEQVRLLYAGTRASLPGALGVAGILAYVQWTVVEHALVAGWLAAVLVIYALRAALSVAYTRAAPAPEDAKPWFRRFLTATIASGLVWGAGTWLLFPPESLAHQAFLGVLVAGLTAGAVASLYPSLLAMTAFLVLSLSPLMVRFLTSESTVLAPLGLLTLLYFAVVIAGARRINAGITENIALRLESDAREAALAESEARYRNLFELSEDPMCLLVNGRIVMANRASARVLEYPGPEALVGLTPVDISPAQQAGGGDSRDAARQGMETAMATGQYSGEWLMRTPAGRPVPTEVRLTRMPFQGQQALFAVWRDVSARKRNERALVEAREAAEQASRAKSEFLATMSHEIRTPLNAVLGMAELLCESPLGSEQQEYAETIHQSGESLLVLLNDILDLSRIEAGRLELEPTPFDLERVVRDVARLLAVRAREKGLELEVHYAPECPRELVGDPARIRQVLLNLAGNAIKFTEEGRVTLRARGGPSSPGHAHLRLEVVDTGIGVPAEVQSRIFEAFTQADGSYSRHYGGSGLGLTISRRLAQLMGGDIQMQSRAGAGSSFRFDLELPLMSPQPEPGAAGDPEGPDRWAPGGRVLLVEDVVVNQKVGSAMLQRLGLEVDIAATGLEAVHQVAGNDYDLVLMDLQMPDMDGYEAARTIRDMEATGRHLPIVAMTANVLPSDRERCLAAGMDDFLAKPFSLGELQDLLRRWLPLRDGPSGQA